MVMFRLRSIISRGKKQILVDPRGSIRIHEDPSGSKDPGSAFFPLNNLVVNRYKDRRDAMITWDQQENCHGYNVLWGIDPDKLYNSWMVYDKNFLELKSLTVDQSYYFSIEAFNENGISERTTIVKSE
jgi:hypothetical protein